MFTVDEDSVEAIRSAVEGGGELAGLVELRRRFPLITDNGHARRCLRMILDWKPFDEHSPPADRTKGSD